MKLQPFQIRSAFLLVGVLAGCATQPAQQAKPVSEALDKPPAPTEAAAPTPGVPSTAPIVLAPDTPEPATRPAAATTRPARYTAAALASVNNLPINREQVFDLLLASHGLDALQQLISLEAVEQWADKRAVKVSEADVQAEYQNALDAITPASVTEREKPTTEQKRRLLDEILHRRGISFDEFMIGMRRNAYLRKLAQKDLSFTDDQLKDEFNRNFGAKVQIRHIVCAKQENIEAARSEAIAGKDFADVARKYSEDSVSAPGGGLLPAFTANDTDVPQFIRDAAFELSTKPKGTVSNVLKVKGRFHIMKVEKIIPPTLVKFEDYREVCKKRLTERTLPAAMGSLHEVIVKQANIQIYEPVLQQQFEERRKATVAGQQNRE